MGGIVSLLYGTLVYMLFLATFLYAIAFVGSLAIPGLVPKTIDSGAAGPLIPALLVNTLLLAIFAIQHSVMARPAFKRWWTRFVPQPVERTTYVLLASLALVLLYWQWRPIQQPILWSVDGTGGQLLQAVFWLGWGLVLLSTFLINHFELFGLRQVFARLLGREIPLQEFHTPLFYRHVRHPIYLGFVIAFWATPHMRAGHLLFSIATTAYIFIGIWFEERDLIAQFGARYRVYREQVGMLLPRPRKTHREGPTGS